MEVKWCPFCRSEIVKVDNKYYCTECLAYIYIQVECKIKSPLLEEE